MKKTGTANLPLHGGKAPRWLFERMVRMSGSIAAIVVEEYGTDELLKRLADPFWFQSFSCVIGFDWHSSGTTTVTMGALKEALERRDIGIRVAGGKGRRSGKVPEDIGRIGKEMDFSEELIRDLVKASRLAAKVDNAALQDNHTLYHHTIIIEEKGHWAVVQQGLWDEKGYARRYHWLGTRISSFAEEPHSGIMGQDAGTVLDMTAEESREARKASLDAVKEGTEHLRRELAEFSRQRTLFNYLRQAKPLQNLDMPVTINWNALKRAYEFQPDSYDELLSVKGVGPGTVRALALVSELIYGEKPAWKDPVKYSFAVGGKDGVPFPVDRRAMDGAIEFMEDILSSAKIGDAERMEGFRRLKRMVPG